MVSLSDDDLELWLSRYIDNELEAAEKEAVEAKLRDNEKWRAEFEDLQLSDTSIKVVAIKYHDNEEFTKHVTSKLKPVPQPQKSTGAVAKAHAKAHVSHRRPAMPRRASNERGSGWIVGLAALVTIMIGGAALLKLNSSNNPAIGPTEKRPQGLEITDEIKTIHWPDGSTILARKGTLITTLDDRQLRLSGEAYFHIAKNSRPFNVIINDKQSVQALGTRFEIKSTGNLMQVRVAEGLVKVQGTVGADVPKTLEVRGGTEITPDMRTKPFDARELAVAWNQVEEMVPPWSQPGGSAGHNGLSPLAGPENLVKGRELFIPFPEKYEGAMHGAVLSANDRAYVLARVTELGNNVVKLLELKLDGKSSWSFCHSNLASLEISPVIAPNGLVVTALLAGGVSAYDPETGAIAWPTYNERAGVKSMCATPDGMIVLTTSAGLTAIDSRDGKTLWKCEAAKDASTTATVMASGQICVESDSGKVYVIDNSSGKVVNTWIWSRNISQPAATATPVAALGSGDQVWLTSGDGYVARMAMDKGSTIEKYFGWQLKCSPIGSGLLGHGSMVMHFDQPAAVTAPAEDTVVALVSDKRNEVFAGYRRGVLHVKAGTPSEAMAQMKETDFSNLAPGAGEMIKNGMAISTGKLVVTTTKGVQVFE